MMGASRCRRALSLGRAGKGLLISNLESLPDGKELDFPKEEKEPFLYRLFKRIGWRAITAETDPEDREELRERVKGTHELAKAEHHARLQQAALLKQSAALARENASFEHKAVDGLGEKVASIPVEIFVQMETQYGWGCFRDPAFMRSFLQKNPQFKIATTRGTRGQQYLRPR